MNLEDCFQSVFKERLSLNKAVQKDLTDKSTSVMQLLETREESSSVTAALEAQKEEMLMKRESLREREENMKKEEEKLKRSILKYNKFLQENDARRLRAIKKAEAEKAQVRLKELEIQKLKTENDALQARKELLEKHVGKAICYQEFLERAAKMSGKFDNIGQVIARLQALQSIHKELLENQTALEKERERTKQELTQYINKQRTVLLHCNNQLHQQQTQLDSIRFEAYKWELKLKHFCSTAEKEILYFAQLKTTIHNIYQMITHYNRRVSVDSEDTFKQLEMIQKYFQFMGGLVDDDLKFNIMTMPNRTEEND
ncbi:coiled-coil domain-containing protein 42 homolog [Pimephales promelas]|uniref:coiled-coil domain-containing protein 42 homolog n=1 Tax=Pimephales promelas TaxID=90988 RepID=UPI0019554B47|nr:coiled-coil domain-containing protein 42 homolog [Pimephales promelas]KAG1958329.1 cilia- and flagella-associated protein [Pimephales promelas]